MGEWNWLDVILVGVVMVSVTAATLKGFVRELISLAALSAAVIVAATNYERAALWFDELTRSRQIARGAGFLALFVGTLLLGAIVSFLARKLVKRGDLEVADAFLGGVFGLVRGVLVDCVLLMALVAFAIKPHVVEDSVLAPYVTAGARVIALAMPRDLRDQFRSGFEKVRQAIIQQDREATKEGPGS